MSLFAGLGAAKAEAKSEYFSRDGVYWVKIQKVKAGVNRQKVPNYGIETLVIHLEDGDENSHRLGAHLTDMHSAKSDYYLPGIKGFLQGVTNMEDGDFSPEQWEEFAEESVSDENPLAGAVCRVEVRVVETKEGNPFTKVIWHNSPSMEQVRDTLSDDEKKQFYKDFDWEAAIAAENEDEDE